MVYTRWSSILLERIPPKEESEEDPRSWRDDENVDAGVVSRGPEEDGCFDRSWGQRGRKQSKTRARERVCLMYIIH